MGNQYRLSSDGSYYIGTFNRGGEFIIDRDDYALLSRYTWLKGKRGYPVTSINRKSITLHRFLLDFPDGYDIDHISGDKLDNRRLNLRVCTHQQNMCNQKMRNTNSTGFTGVSYLKNARAYEAYVHCHGKKHHLGLHATPEATARARDHAARKLFGIYGRFNFPTDGEFAYG